MRRSGKIVRLLTAEGNSSDIVAATLGMNWDKLRRYHALDLDAGRAERKETQAAAEDEQLTEKEETMRRAYLAGYGTHWENADGTCDLHHGNTLEQQKELFAQWPRKHRRGDGPVRFGEPA